MFANQPTNQQMNCMTLDVVTAISINHTSGDRTITSGNMMIKATSLLYIQ